MNFVLDSSVTLPWFFKNDVTGYADAVLEQLQSNQVLVPRLWYEEVANILLSWERQGGQNSLEAERFLEWLTELPIMVADDNSPRTFNRIYQLARKYRISAYDGVYLELAIREGLPLATLDTKLKRAAESAQVGVFSV